MNNRQFHIFVMAVLFTMLLSSLSYAFTAVRPDMDGFVPDTPDQRMEKSRREKGEAKSGNPEAFSTQPSTDSTSPNSSYATGKAPSKGKASSSVSAPAPVQPEPQASGFKQYEMKSSKGTKIFLFVMLFLVLGGVAGWYFTRNVNFNRLFNR